MHAPHDFGLSPLATLAHVADPSPAAGHSVFWKHWRQAVVSQAPRLVTRRTPDPSDPAATEEFEGLGHVRIGCRLVLPANLRWSLSSGSPPPVRGGVVVLHGYDTPETLAAEAQRWQAAADRGLAVLLIRLRGYPGSQLDCGPLTKHETGYITLGLDTPGDRPEDAMNWVLAKALADVAHACLAMHALLRSHEPSATKRPLFLHGESFGGGLAVIAAAQLASDVPIERLVIGLPTLGDWAWRLSHRLPPHAGATTVQEQVLRTLDQAGARRASVEHTLRLFDAVVHATRVAPAVLCKLAERDEAVPAPTAAAIFNALGSTPGSKWRFLVPYGHFDGGVANARRHALFEQAAEDFLDPAVPPAQAMLRWEPLLDQGGRPPAKGSAPHAESASPQPTLFGPAKDSQHSPSTDDILIRAYAAVGRTLDDLPYTEDFETLVRELGPVGQGLSRPQILKRLQGIRKAGKLPRMGRAQGGEPRLTVEEERMLADMVTRAVGSLGQRDGLPYTQKFETLLEAFNAETGRSLSPHDLWRLIAKLAK